MASRARQKEQARERRLAAEQATRTAAARRRRLRLLAGVVAIAAVVVAVAIVVSTGGGSHPPRDARRAEAEVQTLLAGIPQHGETLGDPHARYTLTFFGDLQCPICAGFATGQDLGGIVGGLPRFIAAQVRPGHAKVVYRSLCTATCRDFGSGGPGLFDEQQTAAYAAGEQNRFWDYEELFYRRQGPEGSPYVSPAFLTGLARQTRGLDVATWSHDRGDAALAAEVRHDATLALSLPVIGGGRGTPGIIMSGPGGSRFVNEGITDYGQLAAAMRAVA